MKVNISGVETPGIINPGPLAPEPTGPTEGFGEVLQGAVGTLEAAQTEGDIETQKLAHGEGNLHETMLALEKADVTMKVAMKVRNKVLEAYNDVMRMTV